MIYFKLNVPFLLFSIAVFQLASAFSPLTGKKTRSRGQIVLKAAEKDNVSRRDMLQSTVALSFGLTSGFCLQNQAALASGGATAGGVYLLSAKQRYNERVTAGLRAFASLRASLDEGSLDKAADFFTNEEAGGWKDSSTAGYLLANAFRRTSTTPPDSLPAVKVSSMIVSKACFVSIRLTAF
jgi:hypothetical protein